MEEDFLDETKVVMGVICRVVHAREWIEDVLTEDTFDWYAQDRTRMNLMNDFSSLIGEAEKEKQSKCT